MKTSLLLKSIRLISHTSWKAQYFARTQHCPFTVNLVAPSSFDAKSLLLLTTPSLLRDATEKSLQLYEQKDLQIVIASVDTVLPNFYRHGVSELWMDSYMDIKFSERLEEENIRRRSQIIKGRTPQVVRNTWEIIDSSLSVDLDQNTSISLKLATTVFSTGRLVSLFYLQPHRLNEGHENSGQYLCDLKVALPKNIKSTNSKLEVEDCWIPLYEPGTELAITDCTGNLIKSINGEPASLFLQDNDKLLSVGSRETKVYVKLIPNGTQEEKRYEIIAGGGEWGAKANILALTPDARPQKNDRLQIYMVPPETDYTKKYTQGFLSDKFVFECSPEEVSYHSQTPSKALTLENVFGGGSENGFYCNEVQHKSKGERVYISL